MSGMNGVLTVMLVIGFFALIIWLNVVQARKTRENLRSLAGKLGLKLDEADPTHGVTWPAPRAQGSIDGRVMELYTFSTGAGKSRKLWCGLRTRLQLKRDLEFELSPQGPGSGLLEWFGVKEITVGNQAFDDAFFIRTNQRELLTAALVPEIQARLLAAQQTGVRGAFKLERGALTYYERGSFSSLEQCANFETAAPVLRDLADAAEIAGSQ
jgi:hypothetical protein